MGAAIGDGDATGTILNTESPPVDSNALTGSFADVPTEHDGSAALTLRLQFSEPVGVSYATLRDEARRPARRDDGLVTTTNRGHTEPLCGLDSGSIRPAPVCLAQERDPRPHLADVPRHAVSAAPTSGASRPCTRAWAPPTAARPTPTRRPRGALRPSGPRARTSDENRLERPRDPILPSNEASEKPGTLQYELSRLV